MLSDLEYMTRHERGVLTAALRHYHKAQGDKARKSATAKVRAQAGANAYVASDLLRQLADR